MEVTNPPLHRPEFVPPERGWPLFLTWMALVVAAQMIDALVFSAFLSQMAVGAIDWKTRIPSVVLAVVVHAGQAWLLFRRHPARFGCWTVLPLAFGFLPYTIVGYVGLVVPLIEAAILQGVRRRAWAWIIAGMVAVVLTQAAYWFFYQMGGYDMIRRFVESSFSGVPALPALAMGFLFRGIWIVTEAISAAVLAWIMPPIEPLSPNQKI